MPMFATHKHRTYSCYNTSMANSEHNYGFTRADVLERYATFIEGAPAAFFLVVAQAPLGAEARNALEKSALALGWQEGPTYAWTGASDASADAGADAARGTLTPDEVFEVIEGLDPICVVLIGQATHALAAQAFKQDIPAQGRFRLFGRDACAFGNLETLLKTEAGKKSVWALLRGLPHGA